MIRLENPDIKYKESYIRAVKECRDFSGEDVSGFYKQLGETADSTLENFEAFVADKLNIETGILAKRWETPTAELWIIDSDDNYVGKLDIRHKLHERNIAVGHIGGFIIPSKRGGIYIFSAFKAALHYCKNLGFETVIVGCVPENKASKRIIEKLCQLYGGKQIETMQKKDYLILRYEIICPTCPQA